MRIEHFQDNVKTLTSSWTDATPENIMLLVTEEIGELARAIRKLGVKRWGHEDETIGSKQDIVEELGDVLFLLARVSLISGVNLEDAATNVLTKIEQRLARSV